MLHGEDGNDWLDGGTGINVLDGGLGDDTFVWSGGDAGDDTIFDAGGFDTLLFADTVTIDDLVLQTLADGALKISVLGSTLLIPDQYAGDGPEIEELRFGLNGSTYDLSNPSAVTPVPATVWLLTIGLLGVVGARRNRRM